MPSARIRFAGEAAFLVVVALGLGLARFDPLVIAGVMFVAAALVALLERAIAKEAARRIGLAAEEPMPPPHVERIDVQSAEPERALEPELEATVSERSARAILASAPPPPLPQERPKSPPERTRPRAEPPPPSPQEPDLQPDSELAPVVVGPPREWNLWELQRAVRDAAGDDRREEWGALLIHLREFANADGDLPLEFDGLVRESFAPLLVRRQEPAAAS